LTARDAVGAVSDITQEDTVGDQASAVDELVAEALGWTRNAEGRWVHPTGEIADKVPPYYHVLAAIAPEFEALVNRDGLDPTITRDVMLPTGSLRWCVSLSHGEKKASAKSWGDSLAEAMALSVYMAVGVSRILKTANPAPPDPEPKDTPEHVLKFQPRT